MVLPLRVWLDERVSETTPFLWAHTIDTCEIGCRIGGLRTELSPGQIITVQRGQHKAAFKVVWCKHLEANENQAGIEALDHNTNIWAIMNHTAPEVELSAKPAFKSVLLNLPEAETGATAPARAPARVPVDVIAAQQQSLLAAARRRLRLSLGIGLLLFSLALGLLVYKQVFYEQREGSIEPLAPTPPTARDLARLTPRPQLMPLSLSKPLEESSSRVQVAEAPTGRVVYPVGPESLSGKVELQVVIAANGLVKQIHVLSGKQPLAVAAAEAVRFWHYASATGKQPATERQTSVTVSFLGGDAVSLEFPSSKSQPAQSENKNN